MGALLGSNLLSSFTDLLSRAYVEKVCPPLFYKVLNVSDSPLPLDFIYVASGSSIPPSFNLTSLYVRTGAKAEL